MVLVAWRPLFFSFFFCTNTHINNALRLVKRTADWEWMLTKVGSSSSSCTSLCASKRSEASHGQRMRRLHFKYIHSHTCMHTCAAGGGVVVMFVRAVWQHSLRTDWPGFGWGFLQIFSNPSTEDQRIYYKTHLQQFEISLINHFAVQTVPWF